MRIEHSDGLKVLSVKEHESGIIFIDVLLDYKWAVINRGSIRIGETTQDDISFSYFEDDNLTPAHMETMNIFTPPNWREYKFFSDIEKDYAQLIYIPLRTEKESSPVELDIKVV